MENHRTHVPTIVAGCQLIDGLWIAPLAMLALALAVCSCLSPTPNDIVGPRLAQVTPSDSHTPRLPGECVVDLSIGHIFDNVVPPTIDYQTFVDYDQAMNHSDPFANRCIRFLASLNDDSDQTIPSSPTPPRSVLIATPTGGLCLLDPATGELRAQEDAHVIDVLADRRVPGAALITEFNEEGGGAITELSVTDSGFVRGDVFELSIDDTRLVFGPNPTLALGVREGMVLFDGEQGRPVFSASSVWTEVGPSYIDIGLLEREMTHPQILMLRWEGGLRELYKGVVPSPMYNGTAKLVRGAPMPLVVGSAERRIVVQGHAGHYAAQRHNVADDNASVQDALWLGDPHEMVVITGPRVSLFVLSVSDRAPDRRLDYSEAAIIDPTPRRLLAYDDSRRLLWATVGDRVDVLELGVDTLRVVNSIESCRAESLTLVW